VNHFFDTSVLVAASESRHPHHGRAFAALQAAASGAAKGFMGSHSIAEIYAVPTRLPLQPRVQPVEARRIIAENLLSHLEVVSLGPGDYVDVVDFMARAALPGARIYDALLLRAASKRNPDRIYTFNLEDFRLLAPPELQERIVVP
jgi:predicted nucleic acid-binding protein